MHRILKIATCPSVSGKSQLSYHLGCNDQQEFQLRVHGNTGSGCFSSDWIAWKDIQTLLNKQPLGKPLSSLSLFPLYPGKSTNSPAFLLAVLLAEGIVSPLEKRGYEYLGADDFLDRAKALLNSGVSLTLEEKKKSAAGKGKSSKPSPPVKGEPSTKAGTATTNAASKRTPAKQ